MTAGSRSRSTTSRRRDPHRHVGPDPQLSANDVAARLFALLDRAQISYDLKTRIHQIATSDAPLTVRASHLQSLGLDPALGTAVGELLLARS